MPKFCDLSGQRFGRWTVLKRTIKPPNVKTLGVYWLCECDCGQVKPVYGRDLRTTRSRSCGCLRNEVSALTHRKYPLEENGLCYTYSVYKCRAKTKGLKWALSLKSAGVLFKSPCYYCGSFPNQRYRGATYNGIDRIDSTKGYEIDNCVPCCKTCNWAKRDTPQEEFKEWIRRAYRHLFGC